MQQPYSQNLIEEALVAEIDIWRTASLLIKAHGENAWAEAAGQADDMIAKGDTEGEAVWKRVLAAIRDMQREAPERSLN
jgi:hypothetical protein